MFQIFKRFLFCACIALSLSCPIFSIEDVPRTILRIFNSEDKLAIVDNELDRGLEMIIHQLGMKMEYLDIAKGLPTDEEMENYYAVIVWLYDYEFKKAEKFCFTNCKTSFKFTFSVKLL